MAIGLAYMAGNTLPVNFASPYQSLSVTEFWHRWHITLSRFLRDYVYIPLGGNRQGQFREYANLLVTMSLGGLWHGAGWTFVLWGVLHGTCLVIQKLWCRLAPFDIPKRVAWLLTLLIVVLLGPLSAPSIGVAASVWSGMLGLHGATLTDIFAPFFGSGGAAAKQTHLLPPLGALFIIPIGIWWFSSPLTPRRS